MSLLATLLAAAIGAPQGIPAKIPADVGPVQKTASGLIYSVLKPGQPGDSPKFSDRVTCHYTGWNSDGSVFDSSRNDASPTEFNVSQVVDGWIEALGMMTPGAHWKLTVPPQLGYGDQGNPPRIKPGATLTFEIELLSFTKGPELPPFHPANADKQKKLESGLTYEPLIEGNGVAPKPDDIVELRFAIWTASGRMLECTENSKHTFRSKAAAMPFRVLQLAPQLLTVGARYRFEVPAELAPKLPWYGAPYLPVGSPTIWEVELAGCKAPLPPPVFVKPDPTKQVATASGLKYEMVKEGSGKQPKVNDNVTVIYSGWLTDGMLFDSSRNGAGEATFQLKRGPGGVIDGWVEGLALMKEGAIYRFEIPGALGYGARGNPRGKIPANATLVFEIELLKVGG